MPLLLHGTIDNFYAKLYIDIDIAVVDIIDYDAETLIDRNVTLHHGHYDADF